MVMKKFVQESVLRGLNDGTQKPMVTGGKLPAAVGHCLARFRESDAIQIAFTANVC